MQWQYVEGPRWIMRLAWNLERASWKFFSIDIMLKTLVAHWHKDAMVFDGGTLTELFTVMLWNVVSRLIGFIIRSVVILTWVVIQTIMLALAVVFLAVFVLWPILAVIITATGLVLFVV